MQRTNSSQPGRALMMAVIGLVYAAATQPGDAGAQVACGDVVEGSVTLTGDLGPCDGIPAALVLDGGRLDLGGFTVSCATGSETEGIVLIGKKARLSNGAVSGCECGVLLAGSGRHRVTGVTVVDAGDDAFFAQGDSDKNRLNANTATGANDDGFQINSSKNKLVGNTAQGCGEDGFDINSSADKNKITGSTAVGNLDDGFDIGGDKNKLKGNVATANGEDGIDARGSKNRIIRNTSTGHVGGFDIKGGEPCKSNRYKKNTFDTRLGDCIK